MRLQICCYVGGGGVDWGMGGHESLNTSVTIRAKMLNNVKLDKDYLRFQPVLEKQPR